MESCLINYLLFLIALHIIVSQCDLRSDCGRVHNGVWYAPDRKCISLINGALNWEEAYANCDDKAYNHKPNEAGGRLLVINTDQLWSWLQTSFFQQQHASVTTAGVIWLGARFGDWTGSYSWHASLPMPHYCFKFASPSGSPVTGQGGPGTCLAVTADQKWVRRACDNEYSYFCELTDTRAPAPGEKCAYGELYSAAHDACYFLTQASFTFAAAFRECQRLNAIVASYLDACTYSRIVQFTRQVRPGPVWTAFGPKPKNYPLIVDPKGCDTSNPRRLNPGRYGATASGQQRAALKPDWPKHTNTFVGGNHGPYYVLPQSGMHEVESAGTALTTLCMRVPKCPPVPKPRIYRRPSEWDQRCVNNGTCIMFAGVDVCVCPAGKARGPRCEMKLDGPISSCGCDPGWTGGGCNENVDECKSNPCLNKGVCRDQIYGYKCECRYGYGGRMCDRLDNECLSDPCVNGGTCVDNLDFYQCICTSGWEGKNCQRGVDECLSAPCLNEGKCVDVHDGFVCNCLAAFNGTVCEIPLTTCKLQSPELRKRRIGMMVSQTVSSMTCIVMMSILLVVFIILRDFSLARLYHMGQELTLLLSHIAIFFGRTPTIMDSGAFCDANATSSPPKMSDTQCHMIALFLHYTFTCHFTFLCVEAIHNYTIYTYTVTKPLFNRMQMLAICLGFPLIPVGLTASMFYDSYISEKTCWIDFSQVNVFFEMSVITILFAVSAVANEACGMGLYPPLPSADETARTSAITMSKGGLIIAPVCFFQWMTNSQAVSNTSLGLYTASAVANVIQGLLTFIFHSFGNAKARRMIIKICCFWLGRKDDDDAEDAAAAKEKKDSKKTYAERYADFVKEWELLKERKRGHGQGRDSDQESEEENEKKEDTNGDEPVEEDEELAERRRLKRKQKKLMKKIKEVDRMTPENVEDRILARAKDPDNAELKWTVRDAVKRGRAVAGWVERALEWNEEFDRNPRDSLSTNDIRAWSRQSELTELEGTDHDYPGHSKETCEACMALEDARVVRFDEATWYTRI